MPPAGGGLGAAPGSDSHLSAYEEYLGRDSERDRDGKSEGDEDAGAESAGDRLDQYELVERVGRGSFGTVWRARDTELKRDVAIKIVRPGMDAREFVARFRQEQRMLAALSHPNIATLYGGGISEKGRPYFAMEYIEGASITRFCDRERLEIRQRLEVFLDVCRAVQFAHTNNIAHRDLTPGNVLVAYTQARAIRAVVIDFGLAKALSPGAFGDGAVHSAHLLVVGTPEYMSPEQASSYGQGIDNRTDVYALGVILYELLVGAKPFDFSGISDRDDWRASRDWPKIQRILRDVEPPAPSTRLSTIASSDAKRAEEIASARRVRYEALSGDLSRELQWIPLKAMKKERAERYGTVQALADDIQRYLDRMPITAAPDSLAYRARKFVRRNRGALAIATAIAVLAGASVALGVVGSMERAEKERIAKRNILLVGQRDQAFSFATEDLDQTELRNLDPGRVSVLRDHARRGAELWVQICDRVASDDESDRKSLSDDLVRLAVSALQASRYSDGGRLNTTGAGDPQSSAYWLAVSDTALERLNALGLESPERSAIAVMTARTQLDQLFTRSNFELAIEEGERMLRDVVPRLQGSAAGDRSDGLFAKAERDARLMSTTLADSYASLAKKRASELGASDAEVLRLRGKAIDLYRSQAEVRRARVASSTGADAVRERKDLAVTLERLQWILLETASVPGVTDGASALAEGTKFREEYFERFIAPLKSGGDPGEMQEYAGALMRFLDWDLHSAVMGFSADRERYSEELERYTVATERAVGIYLETLWRDSANFRSYEQLIILMQRCLTPARGLYPDRQLELLDRIDRTAVCPQRELAFESFAAPSVRDAILALRIGVDARRGLLRRGAATAEARPFVEGAAVSAEQAMQRLAGDPSIKPSSALLAEIELGVALARQFDVPGGDRRSQSLEALKRRTDLAPIFEKRPQEIYWWLLHDLKSCSEPLPDAGD